MNNLKSLPIIFWCFIVLITCCFSHHRRLNSHETANLFLSSVNDRTLSAAQLGWSAADNLDFLCCFPSQWLFSFILLPSQDFFRLSQFLLNYMSVSVQFIFYTQSKNCEYYMYCFYATFLDPFSFSFSF